VSAEDEWERKRLGKLAASDREYARWHIAEARRRLENAADAGPGASRSTILCRRQSRRCGRDERFALQALRRVARASTRAVLTTQPTTAHNDVEYRCCLTSRCKQTRYKEAIHRYDVSIGIYPHHRPALNNGSDDGVFQPEKSTQRNSCSDEL
jgi:hypothetical protein